MRIEVIIALIFLASGKAMGIPLEQRRDMRFATVRNLNTTYDVSEFASRFKSPREWKARAGELREQILGAAGLLPMPEKTPLNARIFGKSDHGDYTIEKVWFESRPGLFVLGNLYRPKGKGPFPAVLNPHGHWPRGRFENGELGSIPGRAINFAKQGYVALTYDMIGYGESRQLLGPGETRHPIKGLSTREVKIWGISLGGLQLWNSIRAVDFLESLPDVDRNRIACTGASGGGTQTFLLSAVDDRIKVSAPVNMISAHMQGGCLCENLPNLRIDTNNVEIASLMAPRPMLMVSATGDWTKDTPRVEFPAVRSIYRLLGAEDKLACVQFDVPHNYNKDSREAVYSWFGRWLLGNPAGQEIREQPFEIDEHDLRLFESEDALPPGAIDQDTLVKQMIEASEKQLKEYMPKTPEKLDAFRRAYLPALRRALSIMTLGKTHIESKTEVTTRSYRLEKMIVAEDARGARIPAIRLARPGVSSDRIAVVVHEKGKSALLDSSGGPGDMLKGLLDNKWTVFAVDCFGIGDHTAPKGSPAREGDANFLDTYNRTDAAERVYDVLTILKHVTSRHPSDEVALIGIGQAGLWCLLARPFEPNVAKTVIDAAGGDLSNDRVFVSDLYIPCLRRAGDFRSAAALCAPGELLLHNTGGKLDISWAKAAYRAAGREEALRISERQAGIQQIMGWLSEK